MTLPRSGPTATPRVTPRCWRWPIVRTGSPAAETSSRSAPTGARAHRSLDGHRVDGRSETTHERLRTGLEQEVVSTVGRTVGRELLEVPVLPLGETHLDQVQAMDREQG